MWYFPHCLSLLICSWTLLHLLCVTTLVLMLMECPPAIYLLFVCLFVLIFNIWNKHAKLQLNTGWRCVFINSQDKGRKGNTALQKLVQVCKWNDIYSYGFLVVNINMFRNSRKKNHSFVIRVFFCFVFLQQDVQIYKFLLCGWIINMHLHLVCNCFISGKFSGEYSDLKLSLNHYFLKMEVPHDITISCCLSGGWVWKLLP